MKTCVEKGNYQLFSIIKGNPSKWLSVGIQHHSKTMEIFQVLRTYTRMIGMQPLEKKFNPRNLEILFILGQFSISALTFLLFEASTLKEYAGGFYASITITINYFGFMLLMSKAQDIFELIENIEETIENRKS